MQISKFYIHKNWGRYCGPCLLPHNVVGVGGCFDVATRQDLAGVLVNVDCIPRHCELLRIVGCNAEIFGVFVFAILFQAPVIRLTLGVACASINVIKVKSLVAVCAENPILSALCAFLDNHGMYPLKKYWCALQSVYLIAII